MVYKMIGKNNFQKTYLTFQCYFLIGNTFSVKNFYTMYNIDFFLGTTVALSLLDT